jgi:hypothetical protein
MTPTVRKLTQYVPLTREEFRSRFFERFYDPTFDEVRAELDRICERAWDGYTKYRKSPRTQPAGSEFSDPAFALPVEWLQTRSAIKDAERRRRDPASPSRILIVSGATRSEHTCPGEVSKTRRLAEHARRSIEAQAGYEVDFLDPATRTTPWARPTTGWPRSIPAGWRRTACSCCARCTGTRRRRASS